MFKKSIPTFEPVDTDPHPEYEQRVTSVAEYFRKYAAGKTDQMPQDMRLEVSDVRTADEMLDDDSKINYLGCDDLDALMEMQENAEKFEAALADIELTKNQREAFLAATETIRDANASLQDKQEAYAVLEELHEKVTRARN